MVMNRRNADNNPKGSEGGAQHIAPNFGLVNAYLRTQKIPPNETVVLLDVGHELLEIAILEERTVYFARSAPGGGRKFTLGLDKILKAGLAKAAGVQTLSRQTFPRGRADSQ